MDAVIIQVVLFSTVGACVYMFRSLRRRVKQEQCSKTKAVFWYAGASLLPLILFLLFFSLPSDWRSLPVQPGSANSSRGH